MNFYFDKFVPLCNSVGKSPSKVALELQCSKSMVSNWKVRGTFPTPANLAKIANYFNISVEELQSEKPAPTSEDGLTEKDLRLLNWFRSLPKEKQKAILISQDAPEGLV